MVEHGISSETVPDDVAHDRITICENCPSNKFARATRQCKQCKCFMDVKTRLVVDPVESALQAKTILTRCPLDHWEAYEEEQVLD